MPVRIYDIAKRLGIESKIVLAKAKELGIATARVPSSSLDKITAEFLESHFVPLQRAAPAPAPAEPAQKPAPTVTESPPPPPAPVEAPPQPKAAEVPAPIEA